MKKTIAHLTSSKRKILKSASSEGKKIKMKVNGFTNCSWSNNTHSNSHSYAKVFITVILLAGIPFSPAVKPPVC